MREKIHCGENNKKEVMAQRLVDNDSLAQHV